MALSRLTKLTIISIVNVQATVSTTYSALHLMESGTTRSTAFGYDISGLCSRTLPCCPITETTFLLLQKLL